MNDASDFTHPTISSAFETIVPMANVRGTTNTPKSKSVINVTASARLPQSHSCAAIISGQVATTIVVAHTIAPRNGRKIQMEDPIKATIKRTASTPRVISRCISVMARVSERPSNLKRQPCLFRHKRRAVAEPVPLPALQSALIFRRAGRFSPVIIVSIL